MNHNFDEQLAERIAQRTKLQEAIAWVDTKNNEARAEILKREAKQQILHQLNEVNSRLISDYTHLNAGPNEERSGSVKFGLQRIAELEATLAQVSAQ